MNRDQDTLTVMEAVMSETHTQGKWTVNKTGRGIDTKHLVTENKKDYIEEIYITHNVSNAKLIVQMHNSFPYLLEACKEVLEYPEDYMQSRVRDKVRAAIAEAGPLAITSS